MLFHPPLQLHHVLLIFNYLFSAYLLVYFSLVRILNTAIFPRILYFAHFASHSTSFLWVTSSIILVFPDPYTIWWIYWHYLRPLFLAWYYQPSTRLAGHHHTYISYKSSITIQSWCFCLHINSRFYSSYAFFMILHSALSTEWPQTEMR